MIGRDFRGAQFRGAINYVLSPEHNPRIIGRNMTLAVTPRDLTRDFEGVRAERPDVEKPVHHVVLAFAVEDRRLTPEELEAIGHRYMQALGYGESQYIIVEHRDRPHQHLHIVANRVRRDKTLVRYQYRDWEADMAVLRQIERDYGLRPVEREVARGQKQPTPGEYRVEAEHGVVTDRSTLQRVVRDAWADGPSLTQFVERLEDQAVQVRFYRNPAGAISGISYATEGRTFGGFALGPSYTWRGIQNEGVNYERARDEDTVERRLGTERSTWEDRLRAAAPTQDLERTRLLVQAMVDGRPTLTEFVERLDALGVRVEFNVARTGHVSGVTYHFEGHAFKGSDLGREFSWQGIQKQGVSYVAERDLAAVRGSASTAAPREHHPSASLDGKRAEVRRIEALVRGAVVDRPTLTDFVARMRAAGVRVQLFQTSEGEIFSVGYRIDGVYVRTREMGPAFAWPEMQRWSVRYRHDEDAATVKRAGARFDKAGGGKGARLRRRDATSDDVARVAGLVTAAKADRPSLTVFVERLGREGVEVRLFATAERVVSIGYLREGVYIRGRELGPGHSWQRLLSEGLTPDPDRDAALIARVATQMKALAPSRPKVTNPEDIDLVRAEIAMATVGLPTLEGFVDRMREGGFEVRLYADAEGRAVGMAYVRGELVIHDRELGPGYSWRRVQQSLSVDEKGDEAALARILTPLDRSIHHAELRSPTSSELAHVRGIVDIGAQDRPSFTDFVERVEAAGVEVRIFADNGQVAIGYRHGQAGVAGEELGPGHSWDRLKQRVDVGPADREALAKVVILSDGKHDRSRPTPAEIARVKLIVEGATTDRPTLTEFVQRVEGAGAEVRLYVDKQARPIAIGYGLGEASVRSSELGPGHSWRRLEREGVSVDRVRDKEALAKVAVVVDRPDARRAPRQATREELVRVREAVQRAAAGRPTLTEFVRRVESHGVEVRLYRTPQGRVSGIGYTVGDVSVNGLDLGRGHSWAELRRSSVVYHAGHDQKAVRVRATTVYERPTTMEHIAQVRHSAREIAEWVRRPHRQLVRLAGRLVVRAAAEVVNEIAHAAARRHEARAAQQTPVDRLQPAASATSTTSPSTQPPNPPQSLAGAELEAAHKGTKQTIDEFTRQAIGMAERAYRPGDPRLQQVLARLGHSVGEVAKDAGKELLKTPARVIDRGI